MSDSAVRIAVSSSSVSEERERPYSDDGWIVSNPYNVAMGYRADEIRFLYNDPTDSEIQAAQDAAEVVSMEVGGRVWVLKP